MASRRTGVRALAIAGVTLVAAGAVQSACDSSDGAVAGDAGVAARGGSASSAAGAGAAAARAGTAGTSSDAGAGGTEGSPQDAPGDALWTPTGDPAWEPLDWVRCEGAVTAKRPEHAAPPMVWVPCEEGLPGCQRLVIHWPRANPPLRVQQLTLGDVYKSGTTLRYGLFIGYEGGPDSLLVLFNEQHKPIGAWTGPLGCSPGIVQSSNAHVCLSFGGLPPASVGLLPPDDPTAAALKTFVTTADFGLGCNAKLYSGVTLGNDFYVRDLASNSEYLIAWPNAGTFQPRLLSDSALVQRWTTVAIPEGGQREVIDGWLWLPSNTLIKLIDPSPDILIDVRTVGGTLAWVQSPTQDIYQPLPTSVWTSPFSSNPAELAPRRVREGPPSIIGPPSYALGGGYYAILDGVPNRNQSKLHVYRLSDGRHWIVPDLPDLGFGNIPPGSRSVPSTILFLDSEEIWWVGMSQYVQQPRTIVRQRLDALGVGD